MNLQEQILKMKSMMNLLNESKNELLYHKTSTNRGLMIMNSDKLIAGTPPYVQLQYDKRLKKSKKQKAISFTTERNWRPTSFNDIGTGISGGISDLDMTFVVSKNRLEKDYDVETFNFNDVLPSAIRGDENEYEERVLTDKISPLHKYIVDIIYNGKDSKVQKEIDNYLSSIK